MSVNLDLLFTPRSIAFIGASPRRYWPWTKANTWISGSIKQGFNGAIYPVHPTAKTVLGHKAYPSVLDIPDEIDLAIFTIPLKVVVPVLEQCVQKGVKYVHMLTAGFSETGQERFAEVEQQIARIAREGGVRLIGPNCMGIYSPEGGLSWNDSFPKESGDISILSQSGQLASMIIHHGIAHKLNYNKVVSFGNASDLQAHDFLTYFANDEKTAFIGAYLEGLKDGRAFFEAAKQATRKKPVVIWKGGQTEGGSRATRSHTSAIAGSHKIWESLCAQTGIIPVNALEDLVFMIHALKTSPIPRGLNVAIMGGAGGGSVTMTDAAEREGLKVPHLSDKTIRSLAEFIPLAGNSVNNPLDIMQGMRRGEDLMRVMELLRDDPHIDATIMAITPHWIYQNAGRKALDDYIKTSIKAREIFQKPLFMVIPRNVDILNDILCKEILEWYQESSVTAFSDFQLTARIMFQLKKYGDYLESLNGQEK